MNGHQREGEGGWRGEIEREKEYNGRVDVPEAPHGISQLHQQPSIPVPGSTDQIRRRRRVMTEGQNLRYSQDGQRTPLTAAKTPCALLKSPHAHADVRQRRAGEVKSDQTAVRHRFAILRINLNTEWMRMNF